METTTYDHITQWFQDNLFFAILILICVVLAAIPQIRDGAVFVWNTIKKWIHTPKESDVFEIQYKEEKVVMLRVITSRQFDVVKIEAVSHAYGIRSEYAWKKKYYPAYDCPGQSLRFFQTEQGEKVFDVLHITNGQVKKDLYFDITSFYYGPIGEYGDKDKYVVQKINELYKK